MKKFVKFEFSIYGMWEIICCAMLWAS